MYSNMRINLIKWYIRNKEFNMEQLELELNEKKERTKQNYQIRALKIVANLLNDNLLTPDLLIPYTDKNEPHITDETGEWTVKKGEQL